LAVLLHQFSDWYLSVLGQGGYWLIAGLMALESTVVPIPSEVIIPPAAYLAHTQGQFSLVGVVIAGTLGSWVGASVMYWGSRWLGRPVVVRWGPYVGIAARKIQMAEAWCAHYGAAGVFLSRLLPAWLGMTVGEHPELLRGSLHRFVLLVLAVGAVLAALYYFFVQRPIKRH
jgi:membrane protein DedA with SNARE-associated domain